MTATIYFAGGEDHEHFATGTGNAVTTTSNWYRSAYARCALSANQNGYWTNSLGYVGAPTSFWFTARLSANNSVNSNYLLKFLDASNFVRLQVLPSGSTLIVQKVNTAGTATPLTNILAAWAG